MRNYCYGSERQTVKHTQIIKLCLSQNRFYGLQIKLSVRSVFFHKALKTQMLPKKYNGSFPLHHCTVVIRFHSKSIDSKLQHRLQQSRTDFFLTK